MNAEHVEAVAQVIEQALAGQRKTLEALIEQRRAECVNAEQASELARGQVSEAEDRLREFLKHRTSDAMLAMQQAAAAELARSQDLLMRRMQTVEALDAEVRNLCDQLQQAAPQPAGQEVSEQITAAESRLNASLQQRTEDAVTAMQHAAAAEVARSHDLLLRRLQMADDLVAELRALRDELQGAQPRSPYDVARSTGFQGSEADWLDSLKSPPPADPPTPHEVALDLALSAEFCAMVHGKDGRNGAGIDAPAWTPGIHREGALVQAYLGQFYRALRDTSDEPYGSRDWQRVGTMGLHLAKPYADGIEYVLGDLVVRDYSTFVVDAAGELHLFAARGPAGEKGRDAKAKDGAHGIKGKDGRDGYSIEDIQLKGGTLAVLARNAAGEMQDFAVDLVPVLEQLGEVIEKRLIDRFTPKEATP